MEFADTSIAEKDICHRNFLQALSQFRNQAQPRGANQNESRGEKMKLINSDCIEAMKQMPDNSVDSIVTDPPYELGFMGKKWDSSGIAFNVEVWQEALRVLKPGGHLIAFSGSRTYHRMAVAIEDAGFEIRDQIMWIYGSGFPKSLNVSKAFDKSEGLLENEGTGMIPDGSPTMSMYPSIKSSEYKSPEPRGFLAKQWQGWGTALKPAHEPMVLARKPVQGTIANNVLTFGVGGLNIDATRVGNKGDSEQKQGAYKGSEVEIVGQRQGGKIYPENLGRWPANIIHDGSDEVVELFPDTKSGVAVRGNSGGKNFGSNTQKPPLDDIGYADSGSAARFFYCAKTSKRDRNEGLDDFDAIRVHDGRKAGNPGGSNPRNRTNDAKVNHHPTVKPTDLMRYLVKLVTPPQGTVLDPFMGSGSTGKACAIEGFDFIGVEQDADYIEIARARIEFVTKGTLEGELS